MDDEGHGHGSAGPLRQRISGEIGSLLGLINGALAGVGGVFLTTRSVMVTALAATVALGAAVLVIVRR